MKWQHPRPMFFPPPGWGSPSRSPHRLPGRWRRTGSTRRARSSTSRLPCARKRVRERLRASTLRASARSLAGVLAESAAVRGHLQACACSPRARESGSGRGRAQPAGRDSHSRPPAPRSSASARRSPPRSGWLPQRPRTGGGASRGRKRGGGRRRYRTPTRPSFEGGGL